MGIGCRSENCPTPRERHNQPGNGEQGSVRLCKAEQKRAEIGSLNAAVMSHWLWYYVQSYNTTVVPGYSSWPPSSGTSRYRHFCTALVVLLSMAELLLLVGTGRHLNFSAVMSFQGLACSRKKSSQWAQKREYIL